MSTKYPTFTLFYSGHSEKGNRPTNQDEFIIVPSLFKSVVSTLFAVFDGHGGEGDKVAKFISQKLILLLSSPEIETEFLKDPVACFKLVFKKLKKTLDEDSGIDVYMSGTTVCCVVVLEGGKLVIANLGDSRIVAARRKVKDNNANLVEGVVLTTDHTCQNETELQRVLSTGVARVDRLATETPNPEPTSQLSVPPSSSSTQTNSSVSMLGPISPNTTSFASPTSQNSGSHGSPIEPLSPLRIFKGSLPYPGLVVTRSLGDATASRLGVISEPEISICQLQPYTDTWLVLGTDGVWDGIGGNERLVDVVEGCSDREGGNVDENVVAKMAKSVVEVSLQGLESIHVDDNVTAVCVLIKWKEEGEVKG